MKSSNILKGILYRIEKIVPEELTGKKEVIQRKYKAIYGNESIEERIKIYRSNNLKRFLLLLIGLLIVVTAFLLIGLGGNNYLLKNENGEIIAVQPPRNQQVVIPMEIGVMVQGEEKMESINFASPKVKNHVSERKKEQNSETMSENSDGAHKKVHREMRLFIKSIQESKPKDIYYLPMESQEGEQISWYLKKSHDELLLLLLFPLICVFIYRSRYRELNEEEIRTKKVVQIELSEFITKLILLLDAGLVMSAAFQKIVRDYEWAVKEEGLQSNYFYQQLSQINHTIQEAKGNFTQELKEFAYRTKIPEFIRLANIITDNYQMGSELVEKLTMEGEMLWFTRKKLAVEQGKLAEIKLTLPLMLLILSLLVITIAPVLLEI